jgi:hypothetical protein
VKKLLALYLIPAKVVEDWSKTDPDKRKAVEEKMIEEWKQWISEHARMVTHTEAAGKTKRAWSGGVSDVTNDVHLYSFIEADSLETAARAFENHPHLQIPQSSIEIMEVRPLTGA